MAQLSAVLVNMFHTELNIIVKPLQLLLFYSQVYLYFFMSNMLQWDKFTYTTN